jgi:CheY-like chemotaxis protein
MASPEEKTLLLVEDEFGLAEVLQLMLEVEGWRVVVANHGRHALERLGGTVPDMALIDYMMPVMNGAALGRLLRDDPRTARIPIVMMSAADENEVRREFSGYDAFLHKPYRADDLSALLRRVLAETAGRVADDGSERRPPASSARTSLIDAMRRLLTGRPLRPA